jgi:3-methyladenine DNA glycosylase/8-oxoguanine DNA glycosylase
MIVHDPKIAKLMIGIFDKDWSGATPEQQPTELSGLIDVPAKKVAKKVMKELNLGPAVEQVLDRVLEKNEDVQLEPKDVVDGVREAVHEEVQAAVKEALHQLVTAAAAEDKPVEETKNGNR